MGSTTLYQSFSTTRLKTDPKFAYDLWKRSKIKLGFAYLDGGVESYNALKQGMSRQIRKRYSSKYLDKIGASTSDSITVYDLDTTAIESKIRTITGDAALVVDEVGKPSSFGEVGTKDGKVQRVIGDLTKVAGTLTYDGFVASFSYTDSTLTEESMASSVDSITVTEVSVTPSRLVSNVWTDRSMGDKIVTIPTSYTQLSITNVTGMMHYSDVLKYLAANTVGVYWWLNNIDILAGTVDVGTLVATDVVDSMAANISAGTKNVFKLVKSISGVATGVPDVVTTSSTTVDGVCTGTNSSVVGTPVVTTKVGYYNKTATESSTNGLGCTATYTAVGDMDETVTVTTATTYTAGTRTDVNGTVINTCTELITTTTTTTYTCVNYVITVQLDVADVAFTPDVITTVVPIVDSKYAGYVALDNYVYDSSINWMFKYVYDQSTSHRDYVLSAPGATVQGVIMSPSAKSVPYEMFKVASDLSILDTAKFSTSSMTSLIPPVISTKCTTGNGSVITVTVVATPDTYTSKVVESTTPIIPLKISGNYMYKKSDVHKAKAFITGYLNNLVGYVYHFGKGAGVYAYIANQPERALRDQIKSECEGTDTNPVTTLAQIADVVNGTRAADLTNLINTYESPVVNTTQILADTIMAFGGTLTDSKTKEIEKVMKTFGIPPASLDGLMDSVASDDVYTAAIMVGLQLFNSDATLVVDGTSARAKVMFLLAEMLTSSGLVDGVLKTVNVHSSSLDVSYSFDITRTVIPAFKSTGEYTLALNGGKDFRHLMRVSYETRGDFVTYTDPDGFVWTAPAHVYVVYVYQMNADGSATRYEYSEIAMIATSYDGTYVISTKEGMYPTPTGVNAIQGAKNLDQLILVYPDYINSRISFRDYSILYSDNLFMFVYARKTVKLAWYQSGLFGFVLAAAALTLIAISAPETAGASLTFLQFVGMLIGGTALSYSLNILFPKMNPYMRMVLVIALTYGASTVGSSIGAETAASGSAVTSITVEKAVSYVTTTVKTYLESNPLLILKDVIHVGSMGYTEYVNREIKGLMKKYGSEMKAIQKKTAKLVDANFKVDIGRGITQAFADHIRTQVELETYDPVGLPDWLTNSQFTPGLLAYMSSTDYQRDLASIESLAMSSTISNEMSPVLNVSNKLAIL